MWRGPWCRQVRKALRRQAAPPASLHCDKPLRQILVLRNRLQLRHHAPVALGSLQTGVRQDRPQARPVPLRCWDQGAETVRPRGLPPEGRRGRSALLRELRALPAWSVRGKEPRVRWVEIM